MKKYLDVIICLLTIALVMVSCAERNTPDNTEYYVRYTIKSSVAYYYFSDIYFKDVDGTKNAEKGHNIKSWTVTIGPVKKGFKASVRNEKGTANNMIEVSKNGGPFALKASGENSASYTINF